MLSKKTILPLILLFAITTVFIGAETYYYISKKQENLLNSIYKTTHLNIINTTENLIKDKLNTTLAIALSLAKDNSLHKIMQEKDYDKLDYTQISAEIKENSKYKKVWIQIVDKEGSSKYRSWTDKKGDNILFRNDLKSTFKNQKISTSISVALFNLTLKARTPIFDENKNFLGALEVITHFDSIAEDLKRNSVDSLVVTDKKYKDVLKYPINNTFINDYYIANANANLELIDYVKSKNIERYINISDYIIENNYLISKYNLYNKDDEKLAYILNFVKIKDIDLQIVKSFKIQMIMISVIAFIILFFTFLIYIYSKYLKELKIQENKKQSILDSQSNMIIITNGKEMIDANKKLCEFFVDTNNLQEFKEKYTCICKKFIDMENDLYIIEKDYDGKTWAEFVLDNENENFRVAMKNENDEIKHFSVKASKSDLEDYMIATFSDITQEINKIEQDKEKDRLLFQQSKIAAIADTIKNIAHQWRQPLSVITTVATGMKLQKEFNSLDDESFNSAIDNITNSAFYLSDTIEDFRNFFRTDKNVTTFNINHAFEKVFKLTNAQFKNHEIIFIKNIEEFNLYGFENEFIQVLINVLNNAKDALENKENPKLIFISAYKNEELATIKIADNAGGIDEKIIDKVCEPYFTTKHQSKGTGIGLYMTEEIIVKHMHGNLLIKNIDITYENKNYKGAEITIELSLNQTI